MIRITEQSLTYPTALLMSSEKRKTFEALGRYANVSGDTISRIVTHHSTNTKELIAVSKKIFGNKKIYLLVDDTLILKIYSRNIAGTCDNYSSCDDRVYRSLCSVVAMLTDGNIAIPIDQSIWTSREVNSEQYKTKTEICQQLILRLKKHICIDMTIMDGLYATEKMFLFLELHNIKFEMRFHSNRVIEHKNQKFQIKKCSFFKLSGRRPQQTIRGSWKGIALYFTAHKRKLKNGNYTTVYLASNYKASSSKHTKIYDYRWNIEKFFRTAKQKLGLNDCQARKFSKQENHIMNVFLAYSLAQLERKKRKLVNVEEAIKSIKRHGLASFNNSLMRFSEIFGHA